MLSQGIQSGPEAFHAPSAEPADNKVLNVFFHKNSIHENERTMQSLINLS
jgi:hypothetical protein